MGQKVRCFPRLPRRICRRLYVPLPAIVQPSLGLRNAVSSQLITHGAKYSRRRLCPTVPTRTVNSGCVHEIVAAAYPKTGTMIRWRAKHSTQLARAIRSQAERNPRTIREQSQTITTQTVPVPMVVVNGPKAKRGHVRFGRVCHETTTVRHTQ